MRDEYSEVYCVNKYGIFISVDLGGRRNYTKEIFED